ncbi:ENTH/ANTH/VHS superfamily protein [Quillaja saponaria]|uniref:ENTH/ANTH/VHS superfamily protein n=1 Tax=Quillaja saponaria TaxID=32244 RepID=A0AAD7LD90_QUISA|nr:ENTH/ANTH/VHS superfamily protein [Quillaja saponaria]
MAAGGGTQRSLRKALRALKDSTTVGLAKVNSEYKELDVAIVKATNHDEVLPKEKHLYKIFDAVSSSRPRADVAYCILSLSKCLSRTHNWTVAIKTLIVIHRALREVDPTFREELIYYNQRRGHILNLSHCRDDSSPNAWDYSAWARTYALYIEERLACYRMLKYDVETDRSRTKKLDTQDLLEQLPVLQQLLFRLLACQPAGTVAYNSLIQYAFSIVAGESINLYVAITDGILNLVDKYFEMQHHDAVRVLEIYRKSEIQAKRLSEFLEICRGLYFGSGQKFIKIEQPPSSFLYSMEEYIKEAPTTLMLEYAITNHEGVISKEIAAPEGDLLEGYKQDVEVEEKLDPVAAPQVADLLGMDDLITGEPEFEPKDSLALEIVTPENSSNTLDDLNVACQTTGWELALVTATSSNGSAAPENKSAVGLDRLTLDSLYDEAIARAQQTGTYNMGTVTTNPFETVDCSLDPSYAYGYLAPESDFQMANNPQQQDIITQQQQLQPSMVGQSSTNPFADPPVELSIPSHPPQDTYSSLI